MRHFLTIVLVVVAVATCPPRPAGGTTTAPANAPIRVANYAEGTVVRHPVPLLVGEVAESGLTVVTVVNTSSTRATREMKGIAHQGKFKVLTELAPGVNKLVVRAGKRELPLTLTYRPQTNPYVVRVIWATDNTGDTTYQTPYPNDKQDYAAKLDTMAKLMQTFTAERLNDLGYGRKTFNLELDEQGKVKVHVFKGEKPASEYYEMKDQAWWGHMYKVLGKPFPMEKGKNVVVAAYTRFDPETGKVKGHTALGGGGLGLFGGGDVWAWPSSLQEVQSVFMDAQQFDPKKIFSDSVGRHTRWAIASTTIGATLHELCHTFGLPHTNDPYDIMTRGIDYFNRAFTLVEPPHAGRKQELRFEPEKVAYFPPVSAGLLVASRWFALEERTWSRENGIALRVEEAGRRVVAESPGGVRFVGVHVEGTPVFMFAPKPGEVAPKALAMPWNELGRVAGTEAVKFHVADDQGHRKVEGLPAGVGVAAREALRGPWVRGWRFAKAAEPWRDSGRFTAVSDQKLAAVAAAVKGGEMVQATGAFVDFKAAVTEGPRNYAVGYAGRVLVSEKARRVKIVASADDSLRVWVNGKVVLEVLRAKAALNSHSAAAELAAGENVVIVEVGQLGGAWGMALRLEDDAGRDLRVGEEGKVGPG